jgi:acetyl esterase/lipase
MRACVCVPVLLLALVGGTVRGDKPTVKTGGNYEVTVIKDVAYYDGKDASPERHKLDLSLPKGIKDFPVLFYIHGGGWRNGSKNSFGRHGQTFARNGIGCVAINYRLSPAVTHPAHIEDVARAFAWTVSHIGKHGGNAAQLFVGGHSAGGHLAALLASDESHLKKHKLTSANIKGVIPISGVFRVGGRRMSRIFGDEESSKQASPLTHVRAKLPPMLILYADKELGGLGKQAEAFAAALKKVKCPARVLMIADRSHGSIMGNIAREDDPATQAIFAFIAEHSSLKLAPKETKKEEKR